MRNVLYLAYQSLRSPSFLISVRSLAPRHCVSRLVLTQTATLPSSGPATAAAGFPTPPPPPLPPVGSSERMPAVLSASCHGMTRSHQRCRGNLLRPQILSQGEASASSIKDRCPNSLSSLTPHSRLDTQGEKVTWSIAYALVTAGTEWR